MDPDERITIEKIKRTSFYQKGHQLFDIAHKNFIINNSTGFSFNKDIASPCHAHTSSRDNNESIMKKTVNSLRKKVLSIEDSVVNFFTLLVISRIVFIMYSFRFHSAGSMCSEHFREMFKRIFLCDFLRFGGN